MRSTTVLLLAVANTLVGAQTWCGKNYMSTSPIEPPGGQFPVPELSSSPLLALRCGPAIKPYLPEDQNDEDPTVVSILVDTPVTYRRLFGASEITTDDTTLNVTVTVDGKILTTGEVPLNAVKYILPFSLADLEPRTDPYEITCSAGEGFKSQAALSYLPPPPSDIGSVTKMDMRTGALLARLSTDALYERVFPIGFYTSFDPYLMNNLSVLAELKEQGFTIVHPVPPFDDLEALEEVLDEMERVGLYLMYDMRWTYTNATSVTEQVNRIKSRANLLLWYTADEPDGTSDALNATSLAYDQITSLDGGYHPISLVLNCQNYEFTAYSSGADILMQDTYMIGNNVTFSTEWGTVCTEDYGDCGCDNCKGEFEDISSRMDEFYERIWINGWELSKTVWTVPQAFGNSSYWKRVPTGKEFVVQSIVGLNHGALGIVPWDDPTSNDIKTSASALAVAFARMKTFILEPKSAFRRVTVARVDVGLWKKGNETLVLATNLNYEEAKVELSDLGIGFYFGADDTTQIFDSGAALGGNTIVFEPVGSGAFIVSSISSSFILDNVNKRLDKGLRRDEL